MNEQESVLLTFQKAFEESKDLPRALYGIGINTKYILEQTKGYNIQALMDKDNEGSTIYNLPVRSPEEVVDSVVEIVIITRFVNLNIVYQRIKHLEKRGIVIKGPDGSVLSELFAQDKVDYSQFPYPKQEELQQKIQLASVVSFDMFDTLVQRTVLFPEDIFKLVEEQSGEIDFTAQRIQAQKESLIRFGEGRSFAQIYEVFQKNTGVSDKRREELKSLELNLEYSSIIPRKSAVSILELCQKMGKVVYILSDMYLSQNVLEEILKKKGISGYQDCIVSCEYGKTKESGELFDVLKEKAKGKTILHIGDNLKADVINAQEQGISSYHFMSYSQLLANSPFFPVLTKVDSLADSLMVGTIFSDLFDSPFVLTEYQGRFFIESVEQLAKLCFVPLLTHFLAWEFELLAKEENPRVLYMARDGYLLHEIHQELKQTEKFNDLPPSDYVLASRRGLIVPNLETEEDIKEVIQREPITGNYTQVIFEKLGISLEIDFDFSSVDSVTKQQMILDAILKKKDIILAKAHQDKMEYLNYISTLGLGEEKLYLFDLLTGGTLASCFSRITGFTVQPLSFGTSIQKETELDFSISFFGNKHFYQETKYFFMEHFLFWEKLLAANQGQFICFKDGENIHKDHVTFNDEFIKLQHSLRKQVLSQFEKDFSDSLKTMNKYLVDELYHSISGKRTVLRYNLKDIFVHDDPFNGRTENLFDAIDMEFI